MLRRKQKIGISDLAFFAPQNSLALTDLIEERKKHDPILGKSLERASSSIEQSHFRFPSMWDDVVSLSANATARLLDRYPELDLKNLHYFSSGTETPIDFSKPISSYVHGILKDNNYSLPETLVTSQTQHACAGGTIAMLNNLASLQALKDKQAKAIVSTSDIARYETKTSAELTQGAGSCSILLEKDPELLDIDLEAIGMFSSNNDDFFKPLDATVPSVQGKYSMHCYLEAMEKSFINLCDRQGKKMRDILGETALTLFHIPFAKMAEMAALRLYGRCGGIQHSEVDKFLNKDGFKHSLRLHRRIGNWYTSSLFTHLAISLQDHFALHGDKIIGNKILCFSYGSGNTMLAFTATIAKGAPKVISKWEKNIIPAAANSDFSLYEKWLEHKNNFFVSDVPQGDFYLKEIRKDGFRLYGRN